MKILLINKTFRIPVPLDDQLRDFSIKSNQHTSNVIRAAVVHYLKTIVHESRPITNQQGDSR